MTKRFYLIFLMFPMQVLAQSLKLNHLRCEYKINPMGIEAAQPRLSWELQSNERNIMQTAYRILVADSPEALSKEMGNVWDSQRVNSCASIQISYKGRPLQSTKVYYWKVRLWDNHGHVSDWSTEAQWQMGLLNPSDWKNARWIAYNRILDTDRIVPFVHGRGPKKLGYINDTLPLLRKTFTISKPVKCATIYISGLGHFDLSLNGTKVGDDFLDPGWTQYDEQALYVPFDLTDKLKPGDNTLGVMLGNGFYFIPRDKRYRKLTGGYGYPKMICRLVIKYKDGTSENIVSDGTWKTAPGPITFSSIYGGEDYNANLEQRGWNTPTINDSKWRNAIVVNGPNDLGVQMADPVKIFEHFLPIKRIGLGHGKSVYDFGQNASGIPFIKVQGKKGDTVRITPGELLNVDSSVSQKGSGGPAYFDYILKGNGVETWRPQFTYYGFRYLQVEGAVSESESSSQYLPVLLEIDGLHIRNAAIRVGSFSCSNQLFNKIFGLIDWATQSNMMSLFTDCPHREKLGWLEEVHLMGKSIRYNYDIANLCRKSINDMKLAQTPEGLVPEIAPEYVKFGEPFRDSPEWGSSAVIMPWYVYQWYGDKKELAGSYDMIKRYLAYLGSKADHYILSEGLGDWYDIGPRAPGLSQNTPKGITATSMYYYDLDIVAHIAQILGKNSDAMAYKKLSKKVRGAFNKAFFNTETKQYGTGSQTANAMAVYMQLVEPRYKKAVVANIIKDVRDKGDSLTAGDIGYRYLIQVLEKAGRSDVIFDMNSRSDVPGYGYQLEKGATALTESWQARAAVSNDHLMLGHLMEWYYSGLGGIDAASNAIALNKIVIKPEPARDITYAKASYHSPYGVIATDWKKTDSQFVLTVHIPENTSAVIYLPANKGDCIRESGKPVKADKELKFIANKNGKALIEVGSGTYHFVVIER